MAIAPSIEAMIDFRDGIRTILPGALVLLSEGAYSGYAVKALFRVLKPIEALGTISAYKHANPCTDGYYDFYTSDLTLWLEKEGYIQRECYLDWHITKQCRSEKMTLEIMGPGGHRPKSAADYPLE